MTVTGRRLDLVESCDAWPRVPLTCRLPDSDAVAIAAVCTAMSSQVRLRLLAVMQASPAGEVCVRDLVDHIELAQSTVSHHLAVLVNSGLVRRERHGTWVRYALVPERFEVVRNLLTQSGVLVG